MKKVMWLFIILTMMTGFRVLAQVGAPGGQGSAAPPTAPEGSVPPVGQQGIVSLGGQQGEAMPTARQGSAVPTTQATPQKTPGPPIIYFSLGLGTALVGNGFGTEGNPWIDTSYATLANGYGASFSPSEALIALVGFNLNPNWSVNLAVENYSFITVQNNASNEFNLIPSVRYTLGSGGITPYVSAGFGFNFNTTSAVAPVSILVADPTAQSSYNTQSVVNAVASGGVGLMLKIAGEQGHVCFGAQYEQVFTTQGGFSYYPLTIGYQYP